MLKVLSLFDGMIALRKMGIQPDRYVAYEIDKYAIKTTQHNFPEIEQKGDVFNADFTVYKDFDLLCGGSPCVYWSIAQSPDKRETTANGMGWDLFCRYVRALREAQPKYFIYENNKSMARAIYDSISKTFGFEPIMINAALVSAQNRERYYWVGKREPDGTYSKVDIQQPEDRGILLQDILEDAFAEKDKGYCLKHQAGNARDYFKKHHTNVKFEPVKEMDYMVRDYPDRRWNFCQRPGEDDKAKCIVANIAKGVPYNVCAIPVEFDGDVPTKAVSSADGKVYTVYRVYNGKITVKGVEYPIKLADGYYIIRKLTVRECMRLQTVPEWYQFPVSDTQAYKMIGNGWCVDVIVHLLRNLKKENEK